MILYLAQVQVFMLILARIAGIFIQAPILNSRSLPTLGKIAFAVWMAGVLWFVIPLRPEILPNYPLTFALALIIEVALGYLIGLVCNLIFIAIQAAGEIADMQMGLSVATAFDPVFGATISVVGRLFLFLALMVFVMLDGHHLILSALHQSFRMLPLATTINLISPQLGFQIIDLGKALWLTALTLAAPIVLMIFLSDFSFGIVSRVAPQVNVFMLGFQVKPSLGLIAILMAAPVLVNQIARLIGVMGEEMLKLFMFLKP
jgi:flagellar biosynthetic protein FliR